MPATISSRTTPAWLATACRVLDTVALTCNSPTATSDSLYRADRPRADPRPRGFCRCLVHPRDGLCLPVHRPEAAISQSRPGPRSADHYHTFVSNLSCWGTPLETWKAPDLEGNLAFLRGARLLHETTGENAALSADAHRQVPPTTNTPVALRLPAPGPEYPPLKGSPWSSVGGSITSVSNPHIHPMGVFVSSDLRYLAEKTGDKYYARRRGENGLELGRQYCLALPQSHGLWRARRAHRAAGAPSDGLTVETYPDGSPSSIWFSYNGWAAAAVLEGIAESLSAGAI